MAKLTKTREEILKSFKNLLSNDNADLKWQQTFRGTGLPYNAVTGKSYRGTNRIVLNMRCFFRGWSDNRFVTFNQAKKAGWKIKAESKATPIEFWQWYDIKEKKYLDYEVVHRLIKEGREEKDFRLYGNTYYVFNASQVEGIPELKVENELDVPVNEVIDKLSLNMHVPIIYDERGRCYYSPQKDEIHSPKVGDFIGEHELNSTLLHELAHSTGHPSRLNRDIVNAFGTASYAKEELRAEIASAILSSYLPMEFSEKHMQNHSAYVYSWMQAIDKDPNELFRAINDAESISDYMLEKAEIKELKFEIAEVKETTNTFKPKKKAM